MRTSKLFKNKRDLSRRKFRNQAAQKFIKRFGKDAVYTDHVLSTGSQWADFYFLHPTFKHKVSVCVRTLPYAYNDICENAIDIALDKEPRPWRSSSNAFPSSTPIYTVPKGSTRPRAKMFLMNRLTQEQQNLFDSFYEKRRARVVELIDSGTMSVSCSRSVSITQYGWYVDLVANLDSIQESDLPYLRDLALGISPLSADTKTFSYADVRKAFGYSDSVHPGVSLVQGAALKP